MCWVIFPKSVNSNLYFSPFDQSNNVHWFQRKVVEQMGGFVSFHLILDGEHRRAASTQMCLIEDRLQYPRDLTSLVAQSERKQKNLSEATAADGDRGMWIIFHNHIEVDYSSYSYEDIDNTIFCFTAETQMQWKILLSSAASTLFMFSKLNSFSVEISKKEEC